MQKTISLTAASLFALGLGAGAAAGQELDLDVVLEGQSVSGSPATQGYRDRDRPYRDDRYGQEYELTCRSNGRYERCPTRGRIESLRFLSSRSSGACRIGRDWGVEPNAVWVDNGCRASFQIESGGRDDGRNYPPRDDNYRNRVSMSCSSDRQSYKLCRIRDQFSDVRLEDRRSDAPCRRNTDWGVTREGIWVDNGCRAVFSYTVRGYDRRY